MQLNSLKAWSGATGEILEAYRSPPWLRSDIDDPMFHACWGDKLELKVSFDISLDGESLMVERFRPLRRQILDFLCSQSVSLQGNRRDPGPKTALRTLTHCFHVVDYFLLRADSTGFLAHGFRNLSTGELHDLFITISKSSEVCEQIYDWPGRLRAALLAGAKQLTSEERSAAVLAEPRLQNVVTSDESSLLGLSAQELISVRAWLWECGHYRNSTRPTMKQFIADFYSDTLIGIRVMAAPKVVAELCLSKHSHSRREFPGLPSRTNTLEDKCNEPLFKAYLNCIQGWEPFTRLNFGIPASTLEAAKAVRPETFSVKSLGRTQSISPPVLQALLSRAIGYYYQHGAHLLSSYASLYAHVKKHSSRQVSEAPFGDILHPDSLKFGTDHWQGSKQSPDYYQRFRQGKTGLFDAIRCLFGAMYLIVGGMCFYRASEYFRINKLHVDFAGGWLLRGTGKTLHGNMPRYEYRPIPPVVVDIFAALASLHEKLGESTRPLLSVPGASFKWTTTDESVNTALDMFVDYVNIAPDDSGRRAYVRFHQLRTTNVQLFLYCAAGVNTEDTLRWYLGHRDPEQLWRYASADVPGEVLNNIKADLTAFMVRENLSQASALREILRETFGAAQFDVMSSNDLAEFLNDMLANKTLAVEPIFAPSSEVRLAIIVRGSQHDRQSN